jgi:hypothetical protein
MLNGFPWNLTWAKIVSAYSMTVNAALLFNLLAITANFNMIVTFSSTASLLGIPGQDYHAAARASLDTIAYSLW